MVDSTIMFIYYLKHPKTMKNKRVLDNLKLTSMSIGLLNSILEQEEVIK